MLDTKEVGRLLSRTAMKDKSAFEALYALTSPRLYHLLKSIVKDDALAADLLQEGFLKLWFKEMPSPPDYPWAWLCQSMRNLAIDELRKARRSKEDSLSDSHDEKVHTTQTFSTQAEQHRLDVCLQTLAPEKRNVIVLAFEHGMSHDEIVQHVNSPLGTVKSWIRRGLMELKRCLS
ncbi:RNA polymerase sigma factor [Enterovibrio coralii]|uniref:RNA polymerase subunit sigma n=1 Tax=Enterovibrio coralii TaxID=294935 RepID=A0A135IA19_9GAMM|nr:sigma-70 family RNA polymerase sigma factor [Enterovibrio coralii]KXF82300.1 RNA polymerase subunit sigma [Enterovibrio coralii]